MKTTSDRGRGMSAVVAALCSLLAFSAISAQAVLESDTGPTEVPIQSTARPLGLPIIGPVMLGGSDEASADFMANHLPNFLTFIDDNLGERSALEDVGAFAFDPQDLYLATDAELRVYFVHEGADYRNTLGFSTTGPGPGSPDAALIFPDASMASTYSAIAPVKPGDFVDLGTFQAGTSLDFFMIANGAIGRTRDIWSTDHSFNNDGVIHAVAFMAPGSPYLLIGFEDLRGGGDRDYNDLMFVVTAEALNVSQVAAPEPGLFLLLAASCAFLPLLRRLDPLAKGGKS